MTKVDIRRRVRERRKALGQAVRADLSRRIARSVLSLLQDHPDGSVFCYLSVGSEVDTSDVISALIASGRKVCVPVVVGDAMVAAAYDGKAPLKTGAKGASEPQNVDVVPPSQIGVIIAPLVAFDGKGNRLGQGGGYYDKFMTLQAFAVGVAFSCQQDEFPVEAHDVPLDAVVTEQGIRIFDENYRRKIQG